LHCVFTYLSAQPESVQTVGFLGWITVNWTGCG